MPTSAYEKVNLDFLYEDKELRKHVYLPSSDTFTFVETLEEEVKNFPDDVYTILEMGAGSGYLTLTLRRMLEKKRNDIDAREGYMVPMFYCIDINKKACECIKKLSYINKIDNVEIINTDIFKGIKKCKQFDIIMFNPPYVETEEKEMNKTDIVASYAGGKLGREIIFKFLNQVSEYLSNTGFIYLLLEKSNVPYEIFEDPQIAHLFDYVKLKQKKTLNETIFIFKLSKKRNQ